jgi:CheY-like chemotaxis protein
MSKNQIGDIRRTRRLDELPETASLPRRVTGPLDEVLPWVLEFRIVGTASTIQLRVSEHMTIGRADSDRGIKPDVDLGPYDAHLKGVSRQHAMIVAKENTVTVIDNRSANGTRLNSHLLSPNRPYRLRHGDEITFGQLTVQVLFAVVPLVAEAGTPDDPAVPEIGNGQRVLIIDEDKDVASVYAMILEQAGFRVTTVHTGATAVGHVSLTMPQAVILDPMLPDMDGLDLIAYINRQHPDHHVPLVVVSGATGGFQMNKALEAGADLFLGKPVGVSELVDAFVHLMPKINPSARAGK